MWYKMNIYPRMLKSTDFTPQLVVFHFNYYETPYFLITKKYPMFKLYFIVLVTNLQSDDSLRASIYFYHDTVLNEIRLIFVWRHSSRNNILKRFVWLQLQALLSL